MKKNIFLSLAACLLIQCSVFADTIKFAQIADAHFVKNDKYKTEVLEQVIKDINNEKDIEFTIFSGDNLDSPRTEYLPEFIKIANKLNNPYYIIIGNHDVFRNNGLSKEQYLQIVKDNNIFYKYKKPNYVFKKDNFVFIVVDGAKEIIPGSTGYYKKETLDWLEKQLQKYKNKPVIILQHFPLVSEVEIKSHEVYQKEEYLELLDKYDNVISVIAGHLHMNSEVMRNGVYHITTPTLLYNPPVYKIITITTTKGFSPMIYTELKEVDLPKQ